MGYETLLKCLELAVQHLDVKRAMRRYLVIFGDLPNALHLVVMGLMVHSETLHTVLFHHPEKFRRNVISLRSTFESLDEREQGVFFLVDMLNEVFYEKREDNLQVALNGEKIVVVRLKTFNEPGNVRQLVLYEKVMRMFEVLDDEVDGIGTQRQFCFPQIGRRFKFANNLFDAEIPFGTNLAQRKFGVLIEPDA